MAEPITGASGVALVTGASGGIGYELARLLAADGHDVALVARTESLLERIAGELKADYGIQAWPLAADLSRPEAPDEIYESLRQREAAVDVLVNNAGFGTYGPFSGTDLGAELGMLQVNVTALTHLTKLFLGPMIERRRGKILNVASTAAFQPGPGMAVYFATKAFVLSFSEALAEELSDSGVSVTALCPGPTQTGFQRRADMEDSTLGNRRLMADAGSVARAGYRGMKRRKRVVIPGPHNWLGAQLPRLFPRRVVTRMVSLIAGGRDG